MPTSRSTPRFFLVLLYTSHIAVFYWDCFFFFFHTVHLVLYLIHNLIKNCQLKCYGRTRAPCAYLRYSTMRPMAESCVYCKLLNLWCSPRRQGYSIGFLDAICGSSAWQSVLFGLFMFFEHRALNPKRWELRAERCALTVKVPDMSQVAPFVPRPQVVPKGEEVSVYNTNSERKWWLAI